MAATRGGGGGGGVGRRRKKGSESPNVAGAFTQDTLTTYRPAGTSSRTRHENWRAAVPLTASPAVVALISVSREAVVAAPRP